MKKLFLKLDDLQVDSFAAIEHPDTHGRTVQAHISMASCSCVQCGTETVCESGACGGTRFEGGTCDYYTCNPTCAGYTCEYDTCMAECTQTYC